MENTGRKGGGPINDGGVRNPRDEATELLTEIMEPTVRFQFWKSKDV